MTPQEIMGSLPKLPYRKVLEMYDEDKNKTLFSNMTLPEYSQRMNALTKSEMFAEGAKDSWIKGLSARIDQGLDWTGAPEAAGSVFGAIGEPLGLGPEFTSAGEGFPRAAVNLAPLLIAAPFTGGASLGPAAAGLGGSALLAGSQAYENTGSAGQGLFTGALTAAMPGVARIGGQMALRKVGATLADEAGRLIGETGGQRAAQYLGTQGAALGLQEAGHQASSIASGQGVDTSSSHLVQNVISQLPFLPFDLPEAIRGPNPALVAQIRAASAAKRTEAFNASLARQQASKTTPEILELAYPEGRVPGNDNFVLGRGTDPTYEGYRKLDVEEPSPEHTLLGYTLPELRQSTSANRPAIEKRVVGGEEFRGTRENFDVFDKFLDSSRRFITPEILESQIKPALAEPDPNVAVPQIKLLYDKTLKPEHGVQDVALDRLNDVEMQKSVAEKVQDGATLEEAVDKTAQAVKNAAESAVETKVQQFGANNKIFTKEAVEAARAARKARRGNVNMLVDPSILHEMFLEAGYVAEGLARAGALKIHDWAAQTKEMLKREFDFEADDNTLRKLWFQVRDSLNMKEDAESGKVITKRREGLIAATEKMSHIDDEYNVLPYEVRQSTKSPLTQITKWRNDILYNSANEKYSKFAEIDDALLRSMGNLTYKGGQWVGPNGEVFNENQVRRYMRTSAENAYKAAIKKQSGGEEIEYNESVGKEGQVVKTPIELKSLNEARQKADAMQREVGQNQDFSYEGVERQGKFVVVKKYNKLKTMNEGFASRPDQRQEDYVPPDITELQDEGDAPVLMDENGEVFDPLEILSSEVDSVRSSGTDQAAVDTFSQHAVDTIQNIAERLVLDDPIALSLGFRKTESLIPRARVLLDYILDRRFGQGNIKAEIDYNDFLNLANDVLPDEAQFKGTDKLTPAKEASNWVTTGREFLKLWLQKQPELAELYESTKKEARSVGMGPTVSSAMAQREGQIRLDAIGEAARTGLGSTSITGLTEMPKGRSFLMSTMEYARKYFSRRGYKPAEQQAHADAVENFVRVAAVFPQAAKAETVMAQALEGNAIGVLLNYQFENAWKPVVGLLPKNLGGAQTEALAGMVLGHEAWHVVSSAATRGELSPHEAYTVKQAADTADAMTEADRWAVLRSSALSTLPPEVQANLARDPIARQQFEGMLKYSATDSNEFLSTMASMYAMGAAHKSTSKEGIRGELLYGDGAFSRLMLTVARKAKEIGSAIRGLFFGQNKLVEDRGLTQREADMVGNLNQRFASIAATGKEIETAVKQLRFLDATSPKHLMGADKGGFTPSLKDVKTGDRVLDSTIEPLYMKILPKGDETEIGKVESWWTDFLQLAEMHPVLQPIASELVAYRSSASRGANDAISPFFERDYVNGVVRIKGPSKSLQQLSKSDTMRKALSDQVLTEQTLGRLLTPEEANSFYAKHGVTGEQIAHLQEVRSAIASSNKIVAEQLKRYGRQQIVHASARLMMAGGATSYRPAIDASERLVTVLEMTSGKIPLPPGVDPTLLIQSISTEFGIPPEKVATTSAAVTDLITKSQTMAARLDSQPHFVSEQRFGRYSASYTIKGEKLAGRVSADSRTELESKIEQVRRDPNVENIQRYDNSESSLFGLNPDIVRAFKEIGELAVQRADPTGASKPAFEAFDTAIEKELSARGLNKYLQHRKFAPGREHLDMLENGIRYISTVPYALTKGWLRDRASVALLDPTFQANPSAGVVARQQIDNVLAGTSHWANKVREWSFLYFPAANLSSAMIEVSQPLTALPAQLTHGGLSIASGYKLLFDAYKQVAQAYSGGKKYADPFIDSMVYRLERDGLLEAQTTGYFFDYADLNALNISRAKDGKVTPLGMAEAASGKVSHIASLMRMVYGAATGVSSRVTAVTAALRAKQLIAEGKLTEPDSYAYVTKLLTLTAPGTGGSIARPAGFYSGKWINRSAAAAIGSLQGFTVTMTSMMYRMAKDAVRSGSITSAHSKAFAQLVGTQLLAAGVLGLPAVGTAMAVANQMYPGLNGDIRKGLAGLFGEDLENGGPMADAAMRGIPSRMTGIDLSSRLSLSNMLGISSYDGAHVSNLFGAPGAIIGNLYNAGEAALEGNFGKAAEQASPAPLKNILKLYRNDGEVRDSTGNLKYSPNTAERVAMSIGFTPKRVADMREFEQTSRQQDERTRNELSRFYTDVAELIVRKDFAAARQMLIGRERESPSEFSAAEGLKAAVEKAQNMTLPEDPRRGGSRLTSTDREDLLKTYGIQGPAPSEMQRLQQKQTTLAAFGLGGGLDKSAVMRAVLIDQIMAKDQNITRARAIQQVDKMLRRSPQPTLQ